MVGQQAQVQRVGAAAQALQRRERGVAARPVVARVAAGGAGDPPDHRAQQQIGGRAAGLPAAVKAGMHRAAAPRQMEGREPAGLARFQAAVDIDQKRPETERGVERHVSLQHKFRRSLARPE